MLPLVVAALVVGLFPAVVAGVFAVRRGLAAYRTLGATGEQLDAGLTGLSQTVDRLEGGVARAGETAELERSLSRLAASRARLRVLTSAWSDARASVARLTDVVPRK